MISQKLSDSLRVANVICTLLVVAIHYNTKHDMNLSAGFTWNYYLQEFITNGVARIAVPFFAFVAGFFFFLSYHDVSSYIPAIKKRAHSLFVPYIIASSIIFIVEYLYGKIVWQASTNTIFQLFTFIILKPVSIQFWFLRDLMFLVFISPVIFIVVKAMRLWVVCLTMLLWCFDVEILPLFAGRNIITIETLSYFILGCYMAQQNHYLEKLLTVVLQKKIFFITLFYLGLCVIRIILQPDFANWYVNNYQLLTLLIQNVSIFLGVFLVIALSANLLNDRWLYLSQFTFFVYIFHLLPLSHLVGKITSYMIDDAYKFYLTFPMALVFVFLAAIICKKITPSLYKILSGGR